MKESSKDVPKPQAPLSPEQKGILASKAFDLNRRPGDLIDLLTPIANRDRAADGTRRRLGILAVSAIPVSVLLMVVFAAMGLRFLAPITLAMGFGLFMVGLLVWHKRRRVELSINLGETVLPILNIFREDFARDQPVHLKVDLSPPKTKEKKKQESAPYQKGSSKIVDVLYFDPWMEGSAMLNDGTALSWTVTDSIRERRSTRQNPRGKYKVKKKLLSKNTRIKVQLGLRKSRYDVTPPADATLQTSEKRHVVTLRRAMRTNNLSPLAPKVFVDMVADIYRGVRRAGSGA